MEVIDFKKDLKDYYRASVSKISILDVKPLKYIMIDGEGDPNTSQTFQDAMNALFSLAFTMKFSLKKKGTIDRDFKVAPVEGLWYADDFEVFAKGNKEQWKWTLMIPMPDFITEELVKETKKRIAEKKGLPSLNNIRLETYGEGLSAQILHRGPYSEEAKTIRILHDFIEAEGYRFNGKHHEIYIGDPGRPKPENLKTIIRQPIARP